MEAINASGVAVGGWGSSAFIFNGTAISRFASPGAAPRAINASGLVAGFDIGPSGTEARAARFVGGATEILDLSAVPNPSGQGLWSEARGINANGATVGFIRTQRNLPLDPIQGFVHSNGQATDLGGLGGFQTMAHAINDSGVIVGTSDTAADVAHAFVRVGSEMIDLNSAVTAGGEGWVLVSAYAINASGLIVGEGIKDGGQRAFLLRPAPTISRQPVGTNVIAGNPFTLSVQASGLAPFTYQWRHSGTNLPGATSDVLTIQKATAADAGSYQVIVSNVAGDTVSAEVVVEVNLRPELTIRTYAGLTVTGVAGRTYRIDASNNPQGPWVPVGTLKLESSEAFWLDHESPQNPLRVYRAVEVP
jgi:probable HAF family extracellular repeat protein